MTDLSVATLTRMTAWGLRPYHVWGELPADGVPAGTIGLALDWMTPAMANSLRHPGASRGIFLRVTEVKPVGRGTQSARMAGVPDWFFDIVEAQDRRSNGGPPLTDGE